MTVLALPERLVVGNRQAFKHDVLDALERAGDVRLDFAPNRYIDSAGLGILVQLSRRAEELGRVLAFAGLCDDLLVLFECTGLQHRFARELEAGREAVPA